MLDYAAPRRPAPHRKQDLVVYEARSPPTLYWCGAAYLELLREYFVADDAEGRRVQLGGHGLQAPRVGGRIVYQRAFLGVLL